ncbi:hypothetical protein [Haliangium sp.]|uniref:hypothetical protein n=1 Tax=Haliangium sp. TaxID=2663208 RepID=UPI003D0A8699
MSTRAAARCLVLSLVLASVGGARADTGRRLVAIVGGDDDVRQANLIGDSGEVFAPTGTGTWARRFPGGVAPPVTGAVRVEDGTLFASSARAPLFRLDGATWNAAPLPNRGRTILAAGGGAVAAVGRHVYTWRQGAWRRLGAVPGVVEALWAATATQVYVATTDGRLLRLQATSHAALGHPLPADDSIARLFGHPKGRVFALSKNGTVLRIGPRAAVLVRPSAALAGWELQASAAAGDGALWAAGWVPGAGEAPARAVLARATRDELVVVSQLSGITAGDRFELLLVDLQGGVLLTTAAGALRYRVAGEGEGGTVAAPWHDAQLADDFSGSAPEGRVIGPARTR